MIYTDKSIGSSEPELRKILEKHQNMSETEKKLLKQKILENLYIKGEH